MPHNEFSAEQTSIMRHAVDSVLHHLGEHHRRPRREEVARVVISIANDRDYEVNELVMHTLEKLEALARESA